MLVCVKDKNNVIVAVSTASLKHVEMSQKDLVAEENLPGFIVKNNLRTIVVGNNCPLLIDILRYNTEMFTGKITLKKLICETVPKIKELCSRFKIIKDDGNLPCSLIVAQNSSAFAINPDGLVTQVEEFEAIGWYKDVIKGSLRKNKNLPIKERLHRAFKESCQSLGGYEKGYFSLDTLHHELKIV